MFYTEEEILNELICPRCSKVFVDPRITPCAKTICINCVEEQKTNDNEIDCFFCAKKHKLEDESGLIPNEHLNKILSKRPRSIYRGEHMEQFKLNVKKFDEIKQQLESGIKNSNLTAIEDCSKLKNQIDIHAEENIQRINLLRSELILRINQYESECLDNIQEKVSSLNKTITESNKYLNECQTYLRDCNSFNDQQLQEKSTETVRFINQLKINLSSLESIKYGGNFLTYEPPKFNDQNQLLGKLKSEPFFDYQSKFYF